MTVGNLVGGPYANISVSQAVFVFFALLITALIGLAFTVQTVFELLTGLFFVGLASAEVGPTIQTRLMDIAKESQSIAAALNHSSRQFPPTPEKSIPAPVTLH